MNTKHFYFFCPAEIDRRVQLSWFSRLAAACLLVLSLSFSVTATTYTVTDFTDGTGINTLRGAINSANSSAGPHIINLAAGTYNLMSGTLKLGDIAGQNITIQCTSTTATAVINMAGTGINRDRILTINYNLNSNVTISLKNLKFTNGYASVDREAGGAILCGGLNCVTNIDNCTFENNTVRTDVQIYSSGGAICASGGGTLNVTNSTFSNNINPGINNAAVSVKRGLGGAIFYRLESYSGIYPTGLLSVTDCDFNNNIAGGPATTAGGLGGAIGIENGPIMAGQTLTVNILRNNFVGNTAIGTTSTAAGALDGGDGGAIWINSDYQGNNINYNRFYNNIGNGRGSALYAENQDANINAINNWWGCNGGPTVCNDKFFDNNTGGTGIVTATPYLVLRTTASNATLCAGTGTTVTTGFTSNSAGTAIAVADLAALIGLPVSFSGTLGTLSNQQTTIQSNGTATATYTASTTPGTGTVNAVVDNVPSNDATARASITVNTGIAITDPPDNTSACVGSPASFTVVATGSGTLSYQWYKGATLITGATGATYTISSVATADAATNYTVRVSSTTGCTPVTSGNVTLTVNTLPSFTGQPASITSGACTGNPVSFTAAAAGSGTLSYQWYKGATALANGATGTGSTIAGATTATLTINNPSVADNAANYTVRVTSTTGCTPATSNNATLTIAVPATATATTTATEAISTTNTVITNSSCNLITTVVPSGASPVSGNVTATVTVQASVQVAGNGSPYAQRYYDIVPANNAAAATATVTLYFTQAEFTAYNANPAHGLNLPVDAADAANYKANVRIYQYHGTGTTPGNYTGLGEEINPADNAIVWNSTYTRWEVTFNVVGFSGFYLASAGSMILPLDLLTFTGNSDGSTAWLQWKTTNEINVSHFEIERSADGVRFEKLGQLVAGGNSYRFSDQPTSSGATYFYRLKIVDKDGRSRYSEIVAINLKRSTNWVQVLPNPFTDKLLLNIAARQTLTTDIRLMDLNGRTLLQKTVVVQAGNNAVTIPQLGGLAKGTYLLQINNAQAQAAVKVLKAD
jgi:hypothetical protein